jgi:hypothetical protein
MFMPTQQVENARRALMKADQEEHQAFNAMDLTSVDRDTEMRGLESNCKKLEAFYALHVLLRAGPA